MLKTIGVVSVVPTSQFERSSSLCVMSIHNKTYEIFIFKIIPIIGTTVVKDRENDINKATRSMIICFLTF